MHKYISMYTPMVLEKPRKLDTDSNPFQSSELRIGETSMASTGFLYHYKPLEYIMITCSRDTSYTTHYIVTTENL